MNKQAINALCNQHPFKDIPQNDQLFVEAMKTNYEQQYEKHPYLRFLAKEKGFTPDRIKDMDGVFDIPPLFVELMKEHDFCSLEPDELALTLTSSGTKGQKTKAYFDKASLNRLQQIASQIFHAMGYASDTPTHYFIFSYDITHAKDVGTSWSDEQMLNLAPAKSIHWLIEWDNETQSYVFDVAKWASLFMEICEKKPVRLLGFPAYMYQMVDYITSHHGTLKIHPESFLLAGGGWKNHKGTPMTLVDFASYMEKHIGLSLYQIGDTYGLAEHGIPYCTCAKGHYHVPRYSRVQLRDPLTFDLIPSHKEGLLHLYTPYNTAHPNLSLLTTDVVTLGKDCSCGLNGIYLKTIRRGGHKKHAGCAISALQKIKTL